MMCNKVRAEAYTDTKDISSERKLEVFRTVLDGFGLPFRRPVLLLPFFLTGLASFVLLAITMFGALIGGGLGALFNPTILLGTGLKALLGLLAVVVILELGVEATSRLAACAELGHDLELGAAFGQALRRLPAFFIASLPLGIGFYLPELLSSLNLSSLQTILSAMGMAPKVMEIALIVLAVFLGVRFTLVPAAIVVGSAGPLEAFRVSWQISQGSWWRLFFIGLIASLGIFVLFLVLMFIPIVGWFAAGWLAFAGMTTVLTLAYVRLGGRVTDSQLRA